MNLPKGPDALCFDREVFMKDDFDVDHFVAECRKRVQLEEMREDLELYYKLLKTAMVELINKDYADFVNLSTNLAGMDKTLSQLSVPLGQLREEVLSLRSSVHEVIEAIDERLCKQDDIQKKKMCVLRLIQVVRSVEKIEKILHAQSSKDSASPEVNSPPLAGQILERIATEFNQLQFHAVQSKGMPLVDRVRPRIAGITAMLQQSLEGLLVEGLRTSSVDMVRHCLRTYATIDKTRDAEALVGQALVKPYVEEVVVEQCTKSGPPALQNMYGKLLEFGPHHCRLLREVTGGAISSDKADIVPGYDFMVNSVWPEMVRALEERAPSLFNPGNPDVFYEKYTISMEFVRRFERQCGSQASVRRLRAHSAYKSFQNKWNLPVYFQLRVTAAQWGGLAVLRKCRDPRTVKHVASYLCLLKLFCHMTLSYKEIAGSLENAITECLVEAPGGAFRLHVSHTLWTCLLRCWAESVYLPQLAHRFWKLTLQLLSRYVTFMTEVLTRVPASNVGKEPAKPLPSSASSTSSRTSQEDTGSEAAGPTALTSRQMGFVMADLDTLQEKIPELSDIIQQKLELIGFTSFTAVSESLADSQAALSSCIPAISRQVTQHLGERCFSYLRSASEVPRLYRRTNKEVPTRASAYVDNALRPLLQLQSDCRDMLKPPIIQEWLRITLCDCTQRYHETISDVLSSVKKMEESLKRLKQARKTATSNPAGPGGGPTDDSKIRLQLALDVEYLGEQIQKMGLQPSDVTLFPALLELVQGARDIAPSEAPAPQSTQPAGL